jgi:hypothetical protein
MNVGVVGVTMLWFRKGGSSQIAVEVKIYIPFLRDHGDLVKTHGPQASRTIPMIHTGSNILDDLLRVESHMASPNSRARDFSVDLGVDSLAKL